MQQVGLFQELYWNQFCARDLIEEKNCFQSNKEWNLIGFV